MERSEPFDAARWASHMQALLSRPLDAESKVALGRVTQLCPTGYTSAIAPLARRLLDVGDYASAEALFLHHLVGCPFADLWVVYTEHVIAQKLAPAQAACAAGGNSSARHAELAQGLASAQRSVLEAFEFAVEHVGASFDAGPLWCAYCLFVSSLPADSAYAMGQARELRRRAYTRALVHAHEAVDELWEQYLAFEREISQAKLAENLIGKVSGEQGTASAVFKERSALWKFVDTRRLPLPPPRPEGAGDLLQRYHDETAMQLGAWRRLLSYERSNPLMLPSEGHDAVLKLVYKQALSCLRYCPDLWHEYATYVSTSGPPAAVASNSAGFKAAEACLREALSAMPTCVSLVACTADMLEGAGVKEGAGEVVKTMLTTLHAVAEGRYGGWRTAPIATDGGADERGNGGAGTGGGAQAEEEEEDEEDEEEAAPGVTPSAKKHASKTAVTTVILPKDRVFGALDGMPAGSPSPVLALCRVGDEEDARRAIPHLFIMHQRLARRTEGVDGARAVFAAARKSPWTTPRVYLSSAQLEYTSNRALTVARNICEAARKKWPQDAELACAGIDFLTPLDDSTNVRAFIEACLTSLRPADSRPVWDRFVAYELAWAQGGGSLAAVQAVEKRRAVVHTHLAGHETSTILRTVHRHAVWLPSGMPLGSLSAFEADLYSRHRYAPFAGVSAPGGSAPRDGTADEPASVDTPLSAVYGRQALRIQREGAYLQALPLFSGTLSHVPAIDALQVARMAEAAQHRQPGTAAAVVEARPVAQAAAPGAAGRAGSAAPAFVHPPASIHTLLTRLPAFDPAAGPLPNLDDLIRQLTGWGEGGVDAGRAGSGKVGVKRARVALEGDGEGDRE